MRPSDALGLGIEADSLGSQRNLLQPSGLAQSSSTQAYLVYEGLNTILQNTTTIGSNIDMDKL